MAFSSRVCGPGLLPAASPLNSRPCRDIRVRAKPDREERSRAIDVGAFVGLASVVSPQVAKAADADVDSTVGAVKDAVDVAADYIKIALKLLNSGAQTAKEGYEVAAPVVKDVYEKVAPVVSSGLSDLKDAAAPAITAATPSVEGGARGAESFLAGQGINVEVIKSGAGTAAKTTGDIVTAATPTAKGFFNFLTTSDPIVLGEYGLALAVLYFFGPSILAGLFDSLKGFAGDVSAPTALDSVETNRKAFIIDIRSMGEKEKNGVPDLPSNAGQRYIEVPFAETASSKLRNQLRNAQEIECQVTAIQISALRKLSKDCTLYLLDRSGSSSASVARDLARRGFKNCFAIQGGYSGWTQCKLQVKPSSTVSFAEVIAPTVGTIFTPGRQRKVATSTTTSRRKALPPPSK
ncbi:hypothetical protein BSKO_08616 [Bryopsis sp. KO-2023]|nr:hypothetical protein BSKO_08616 [Bryopsis sp. KO-2023]